MTNSQVLIPPPKLLRERCMKTYKKNSLIQAVTLASALSTLCLPATADTILGIYAGAGVWNASFDGEINGEYNGDTTITTDQLGVDSSNNTFMYVALEHPIPVIPNIRLSVTDLTTDGSGSVDEAFTFQGITYTTNTPTNTEIDLSHTDVTFYYEILDNWVSMDFGLTARKFDGLATITSDTDEGSVTLDTTIPMLYGKARFDLPFSGWYVAGTLNYIGYSDAKISDFDGKIGYQSDGLALDFGVDLGYRTLSIDLEDSDDLNANISVDGPYASVTVHF